jgi:hypothetical protein
LDDSFFRSLKLVKDGALRRRRAVAKGDPDEL